MTTLEFETIKEELNAIFPGCTCNCEDDGKFIKAKTVVEGTIEPAQTKQLLLIGEPYLKRSGKGTRVLLVVDKDTVNTAVTTEYGKLVKKASRYDAIDVAVGKFYTEDGEGEAEEKGDLADIGEKVCLMLGYL